MPPKKKIFIGVALFICFLLVFGFGFIAGKKIKPEQQPKITYRIDQENSKLIEKRYFYFTGQVSEFDLLNNTITLFGGGESVKIEIKKDIQVTSYAFRPDDKTPNEQPKTLALKDILVGDKVSIYAEVQPNGVPLGTSVYIHFVPVRAL